MPNWHPPFGVAWLPLALALLLLSFRGAAILLGSGWHGDRLFGHPPPCAAGCCMGHGQQEVLEAALACWGKCALGGWSRICWQQVSWRKEILILNGRGTWQVCSAPIAQAKVRIAQTSETWVHV